MFYLLILGVLVLLLLLYFLAKKLLSKNSTYWQDRGVTLIDSKVTGSFFYNIRNKVTILEKDTKIYKHMQQLQKPYLGAIEFSQPSLIIGDLDLIKSVLVKDFDHFVNRRSFATAKDTDPHLTKLLFNQESDDWKQLRVKMTPTFTTGKIRKMFKLFDTSCKRLSSYFREEIKNSGTDFDVSSGFYKFTADIIASSAFGVESHAFEEKVSMFEKMGERLQLKINIKLVIKFLVSIIIPKLAKLLGLRLFDLEADNFFTKVILGSMQHRRESGERRDDFLQLMMDAQSGQLKSEDTNPIDSFEKDAILYSNSEEGKSSLNLDDDLIVANCILFLLAGFDTTQSLLVFVSYQLALNPEVQEKLYEEVVSSVDNGEFTYESVNRMEYMDKVIHETLRLYPPAMRLERRCTEDYKIPNSDIVIKKDQMIIIPTFPIQRDPKIYPDPNKFDPERFSPENKAQRNPYAYMPFGHGPRNCIGMRFALMESKLAVANLVKQFLFEPCAKTDVPIRFQNTASLKPLNGMWLQVTNRVE